MLRFSTSPLLAGLGRAWRSLLTGRSYHANATHSQIRWRRGEDMGFNRGDTWAKNRLRHPVFQVDMSEGEDEGLHSKNGFMKIKRRPI
ncbi:hypothetical protein BO82DRAFT_351846 [Aspergillus uvarum CBS 121591]|uniref:Uncharacterized protein n=1 Tax=Aspergillus uvarum CBS 121591 TaxID=1448315 RepID=A0A319D0Z2_9EURO|nr:hypothetical protein BO82DRAFT_351846 [Aspergillus uvarum CBS 121591]PYH84683.1 hypothetical protein BO82DRAFT_351846 [Aspergillus uvarum CBS 121591]